MRTGLLRGQRQQAFLSTVVDHHLGQPLHVVPLRRNTAVEKSNIPTVRGEFRVRHKMQVAFLITTVHRLGQQRKRHQQLSRPTLQVDQEQSRTRGRSLSGQSLIRIRIAIARHTALQAFVTKRSGQTGIDIRIDRIDGESKHSLCQRADFHNLSHRLTRYCCIIYNMCRVQPLQAASFMIIPRIRNAHRMPIAYRSVPEIKIADLQTLTRFRHPQVKRVATSQELRLVRRKRTHIVESEKIPFAEIPLSRKILFPARQQVEHALIRISHRLLQGRILAYQVIDK